MIRDPCPEQVRVTPAGHFVPCAGNTRYRDAIERFAGRLLCRAGVPGADWEAGLQRYVRLYINVARLAVTTVSCSDYSVLQ